MLVNIYNKKLTTTEVAIVALFPLVAFHFYQYIGIPRILERMCFLFLYLLVFLFTLKELFRKTTSIYHRVVKYIFACFIISSITAFCFWEQSFVSSYIAYINTFSGYMYFFILYRIKPTPSFVIWIVVAYAVIWMMAYCIAFISLPNIIFGDPESDWDMSRGFYRIKILGGGFVFLAYYMSVNNACEKKGKKWSVLALALFCIIVLMLTRQYIAITVVITTLYLMTKSFKAIVKLAILAAAIVLLVTPQIISHTDNPLKTMYELTMKQVTGNDIEEDVRMKGGEYFLTEFPNNIVTTIFGNGYAHPDSSYGKWELTHCFMNAYIRADIGYIGLYITYGILGFMVFLAMFYHCFKAKLPGEMSYIKLFMLHIASANILSWPIRGDAIEISICLYLFHYYWFIKRKKYYGRNSHSEF